MPIPRSLLDNLKALACKYHRETGHQPCIAVFSDPSQPDAYEVFTTSYNRFVACVKATGVKGEIQRVEYPRFLWVYMDMGKEEGCETGVAVVASLPV